MRKTGRSTSADLPTDRTRQCRFDLRRITRSFLGAVFRCVPVGALAGCAARPSIGVLGAYFPDWLFCAVGALVLTLVVHGLAGRVGAQRWLVPQALAYPTLFAFFALAAWLLVFLH